MATPGTVTVTSKTNGNFSLAVAVTENEYATIDPAVADRLDDLAAQLTAIAVTIRDIDDELLLTDRFFVSFDLT